MSNSELRVVPVAARLQLISALADALAGGPPLLPIAKDAYITDAWVQELLGVELPVDTAVVLRTSGSSGIPKAVALSAAALQASAAATHEALGGAGQWLVTLPGNLISGLQMLVRSLHAGTEPVFYEGPFDAAAVLQRAATMTHARRYVSVVPVQLARLLELAEQDETAAKTLREFAGVLVGGQATPLQLRQRAYELGIKLRRSYGMTETAGGCVYDGVEIGDTRVRIRAGEVQIAGSCLALGYIGVDAPNREKFSYEGDTRWYRTGDAGQLLGGMLTITGRLDRVVISGGVNVSLDEIERVVGELPGWQGTVAVSEQDADWGERPVLVREQKHTQQAESASTTEKELREHLRSELGKAAVPKRVVELPELPRLTGGKPDYAAIRAAVAGDSNLP